MERINPNFEILNLDIDGKPKYRWMYLDSYSDVPNQKGFISYRHFICYALHNLLHKDIKEDVCRQKLQEFKNAYEERRDFPDKDKKTDFLEIAFYHKREDYFGDVLILDKTKGCYPLTLHDETRRHEFSEALKNINYKTDIILPFLKDWDKWNEELEESLDKILKSNNIQN